jgi:hypothetical protein
MMTDTGREHTIAALVSASTELLERLNAAESPLSVVSASLTGLAHTLGVEQAMVAIDDAQYGRQVFSSGRRPLGDSGDLLWGPPGVRTDPPHAIDEALARLIVAAVTTTFASARANATTPAVRAPGRPEDLIGPLGVATERSARYGWSFTVVLLRLDAADDRTPGRIRAHLRASDTLIELGTRDLGIVLPAAACDQIPEILARVGRGGTVSTFCYGLAACPGDANEPSSLLALATVRLRDAASTRRAPEVHALEPPKV